MPDTPIAVNKPQPVKRQPQDAWHTMRNEFDRLFDSFGSSFRVPSFHSFFDPMPQPTTSFEFTMPAVDVSEDEKGYKITAELPGISEKDVDVTVTSDGVLVIKGEKRQEKEEKDKNRYLSERAYGSFQRSFVLPTGTDHDKVAADFAKGVLTVSIPKTAEAQTQTKKIEVQAKA